MGRWSYMHFRRKNLAPLTFISVYQVNVQPTNAQGTTTAWHQQRRALDQAGRDSEHPRTAFINNLTKFIKDLQTTKHEIIVGGDWNETLEDRRSRLLKLATNCNLTHPWLLRHPDIPDFKTQDQGSRRINSVLVSHRLASCIQGIGYAPFKYITNSDHRPLFIDFDTKALFGDETDMRHADPTAVPWSTYKRPKVRPDLH
jgi:exonuclease III